MDLKKFIFCAVDFKEVVKAKFLINKIKNHIGGIKIGLEFFVHNGPRAVEQLKKFNLPIFLDLKLHDIPNTVFEATKSVLELEPDFLSVHISGGAKMIEKISNIKCKTKIIGITMLTSLGSQDLLELGIKFNPDKYVNNLSKMAVEHGLDGIVCSPKELETVSSILPKKFIIITPGIRLKNNVKNDDQKRILSPGEAILKGSKYLVIGRPITKARNPIKVIKNIENDILKFIK